MIASNCCKIEAIIQRCCVKKVFWIVLQNSQENPCTRVSFLIKMQLKKRLWHWCFPVNIAKLLRTPFFIAHLRWLPLVNLEPSLRDSQNFSYSYFWPHWIWWSTSTVTSCKTRYSQKKNCSGVHSYLNSKFKIFKLK